MELSHCKTRRYLQVSSGARAPAFEPSVTASLGYKQGARLEVEHAGHELVLNGMPAAAPAPSFLVYKVNEQRDGESEGNHRSKP